MLQSLISVFVWQSQTDSSSTRRMILLQITSDFSTQAVRLKCVISILVPNVYSEEKYWAATGTFLTPSMWWLAAHHLRLLPFHFSLKCLICLSLLSVKWSMLCWRKDRCGPQSQTCCCSLIVSQPRYVLCVYQPLQHPQSSCTSGGRTEGAAWHGAKSFTLSTLGPTQSCGFCVSLADFPSQKKCSYAVGVSVHEFTLIRHYSNYNV